MLVVSTLFTSSVSAWPSYSAIRDESTKTLTISYKQIGRKTINITTKMRFCSVLRKAVRIISMVLLGKILTWASEVASAFGVRVPIARDSQIVFVVSFVGVREAVYQFIVDVFGF
jgi:hypothetical protein